MLKLFKSLSKSLSTEFEQIVKTLSRESMGSEADTVITRSTRPVTQWTADDYDTYLVTRMPPNNMLERLPLDILKLIIASLPIEGVLSLRLTNIYLRSILIQDEQQERTFAERLTYFKDSRVAFLDARLLRPSVSQSSLMTANVSRQQYEFAQHKMVFDQIAAGNVHPSSLTGGQFVPNPNVIGETAIDDTKRVLSLMHYVIYLMNQYPAKQQTLWECFRKIVKNYNHSNSLADDHSSLGLSASYALLNDRRQDPIQYADELHVSLPDILIDDYMDFTLKSKDEAISRSLNARSLKQ